MRISPAIAGFGRWRPPIFDKNHNEFVFDSFLKLRSGEKIKFISRSDKGKLMKDLLEINRELRIQIYDNTSGEAILIN
jgi:uncharacterized protein (DUF2249 family)